MMGWNRIPFRCPKASTNVTFQPVELQFHQLKCSVNKCSQLFSRLKKNGQSGEKITTSDEVEVPIIRVQAFEQILLYTPS